MLLLIFVSFQTSQLWLVEGLRDRHRARIGIRRHRHYDDKHGDDLDHIKAAVDIFDDQEAFDDSAELLQGAENGRYKVIAKAEPYKNLPVRYLRTIVTAFTTSKPFCLVLVLRPFQR